MALFHPQLADTRAPRRGEAPDRGPVGGPRGREDSPEDSEGMEPLMFSKSVQGASIIRAPAARPRGQGARHFHLTFFR